MDLNADLGEGFGRWELTDDAGLLRAVTSANVACGFHAGDPPTMHRVCEAAAESGVRIGAQVSYRDLAGFGRREMDVPPAELACEIAYQIGALRVFAEAAGAAVRYVKPHGALYHRAGRDPVQAVAVIEGMRLAGVGVLLCRSGTELARAAEAAGIRIVAEAFADRGYRRDGRLVPRGEPGALLDRAAAVAQAVSLARDGAATSADGARVPVEAASICVHGDGREAVEISTAIRTALDEQGIKVEAF